MPPDFEFGHTVRSIAVGVDRHRGFLWRGNLVPPILEPTQG